MLKALKKKKKVAQDEDVAHKGNVLVSAMESLGHRVHLQVVKRLSEGSVGTLGLGD